MGANYSAQRADAYMFFAACYLDWQLDVLSVRRGVWILQQLYSSLDCTVRWGLLQWYHRVRAPLYAAASIRGTALMSLE